MINSFVRSSEKSSHVFSPVPQTEVTRLTLLNFVLVTYQNLDPANTSSSSLPLGQQDFMSWPNLWKQLHFCPLLRCHPSLTPDLGVYPQRFIKSGVKGFCHL